MPNRFEARYVKPENVCIGDTIRVRLTDKDTTVERVGTVASREYEGSDRVLFTKEGVELLRWNPHYAPPRITLVNRETEQPMLAMFENSGRL